MFIMREKKKRGEIETRRNTNHPVKDRHQPAREMIKKELMSKYKEKPVL